METVPVLSSVEMSTCCSSPRLHFSFSLSTCLSFFIRFYKKVTNPVHCTQVVQEHSLPNPAPLAAPR